MRLLKILIVGIIAVVIMAGIFACNSQKDTQAYLESVDAFIAEVEQ